MTIGRNGMQHKIHKKTKKGILERTKEMNHPMFGKSMIPTNSPSIDMLDLPTSWLPKIPIAN